MKVWISSFSHQQDNKKSETLTWQGYSTHLTPDLQCPVSVYSNCVRFFFYHFTIKHTLTSFSFSQTTLFNGTNSFIHLFLVSGPISFSLQFQPTLFGPRARLDGWSWPRRGHSVPSCPTKMSARMLLRSIFSPRDSLTGFCQAWSVFQSCYYALPSWELGHLMHWQAAKLQSSVSVSFFFKFKKLYSISSPIFTQKPLNLQFATCVVHNTSWRETTSIYHR